jgi:hypothetical protein
MKYKGKCESFPALKYYVFKAYEGVKVKPYPFLT